MEVAGPQSRGGPCALEFAMCVGFAMAEEPAPSVAQGMYVLRPSTADANLKKCGSVQTAREEPALFRE